MVNRFLILKPQTCGPQKNLDIHNIVAQAVPTQLSEERARVLLVDDDPIIREVGAAKLREAGYDAITAKNGVEALDRLAQEGIDLVISDLDMPQIDGFELTRRIRADESVADTPVIVITASDQAEAVDLAFAAGATSFLSKPINWTLFGQSVQFVLKASRDQRALRAARDQAKAGERFKDALLSIMSHELRTPLNAIIGFGQLLSDQLQREKFSLYADYAEYIVESGKRLLETVSDMLLASEARSGTVATNEADWTVGEIIAAGGAAIEKRAKLAEAEIRTVIPDIGFELHCDRTLIASALAKLVDNAVKFSPRKTKIVVAATLTSGGGLAILVEDDGPGIPSERLSHLSESFTQTDMSLRRSKEGLGLGLSLVKAIAAAHDAAFRIDSKPGEGTRALLLFPASRLVSRKTRRKETKTA